MGTPAIIGGSMRLSILMPAYNEEATIAQIIDLIDKLVVISVPLIKERISGRLGAHMVYCDS